MKMITRIHAVSESYQGMKDLLNTGFCSIRIIAPGLDELAKSLLRVKLNVLAHSELSSVKPERHKPG